MKRVPIDLFRWHRPVGGFQWIDATPFPASGTEKPHQKPEPARYLVEQDPSNRMVEYYNPLVMHPTLYETFAKLQPTEDEFLAFANQHGRLGGGVPLTNRNPFSPAESFQYWRNAHWRLGQVVDEIIALRDRDIETLRRWFQVNQDVASYERLHEGAPFPSGALIAMRKHDHKTWLLDWALAGSSEDEILLRVAAGWAQKEVNAAMSGEGREPHASTTAHVVLDQDIQRMTLHVVPNSLLAAMWLQCAKVLTEDKILKTCGHCGKKYEVAAGTREQKSRYCSHACKIAAYRVRRTGNIPLECPACHKKMIAECEVHVGFGYMNQAKIPCPHCSVVTEHLVPSNVLSVRKPRAKRDQRSTP